WCLCATNTDRTYALTHLDRSDCHPLPTFTRPPPTGSKPPGIWRTRQPVRSTLPIGQADGGNPGTREHLSHYCRDDCQITQATLCRDCLESRGPKDPCSGFWVTSRAATAFPAGLSRGTTR